MRKILLIIASIALLTSCSTLKPTERMAFTSFVDYRPYSESGFLLTPQPYQGDYDSVGEISIYVVPAFLKLKEDFDYMSGEWYTYKFETIKLEEIVELAVKEAIEKGADAVSNFSITSEKISRGNGRTYSRGDAYRVTGFCIKRK